MGTGIITTSPQVIKIDGFTRGRKRSSSSLSSGNSTIRSRNRPPTDESAGRGFGRVRGWIRGLGAFAVVVAALVLGPDLVPPVKLVGSFRWDVEATGRCPRAESSRGVSRLRGVPSWDKGGVPSRWMR